MLLTTLLKKVVSYLAEHPAHEGVMHIQASVDATNKAFNANRSVDKFIMSYDARSIGSLRDIVPEAFPKKLRTGPIEAKKNSLGTWRVDPVTPQ